MAETRRTGLLFLAFVIGHVVLISAQVTSKPGVPVLEDVTFSIFSEVQRVSWSVVSRLRDTWMAYGDLRTVHSDNERLRRELIELQAQLQAQRDLASQSQRLAQLLKLRESVGLNAIAAQVIGGDASPGLRSRTIDRGSSDGLARDMPVIAAGGIVGRVVRLGTRAAVVQLLVDRDAAAGALIERSRTGGVVVGADGEPPLQLRYVSETADVVVGDTVVTSGIDGIYPKGFVLGTVVSVERGSGSERLIRVRPAVDMSGLEEVLVVVPPPRPAAEGRP